MVSNITFLTSGSSSEGPKFMIGCVDMVSHSVPGFWRKSGPRTHFYRVTAPSALVPWTQHPQDWTFYPHTSIVLQTTFLGFLGLDWLQIRGNFSRCLLYGQGPLGCLENNDLENDDLENDDLENDDPENQFWKKKLEKKTREQRTFIREKEDTWREVWLEVNCVTLQALALFVHFQYCLRHNEGWGVIRSELWGSFYFLTGPIVWYICSEISSWTQTFELFTTKILHHVK